MAAWIFISQKMRIMKSTKFMMYVAFSLGLAAACYLRPSPNDFDRYVYESLIRSAKQPIEDIYPS